MKQHLATEAADTNEWNDRNPPLGLAGLQSSDYACCDDGVISRGTHTARKPTFIHTLSVSCQIPQDFQGHSSWRWSNIWKRMLPTRTSALTAFNLPLRFAGLKSSDYVCCNDGVISTGPHEIWHIEYRHIYVQYPSTTERAPFCLTTITSS